MGQGSSHLQLFKDYKLDEGRILLTFNARIHMKIQSHDIYCKKSTISNPFFHFSWVPYLIFFYNKITKRKTNSTHYSSKIKTLDQIERKQIVFGALFVQTHSRSLPKKDIFLTWFNDDRYVTVIVQSSRRLLWIS